MTIFLTILVLLLLAALGYGYYLYSAAQRRITYLERKQGHLEAQLKEAEGRAVSAEKELTETLSNIEMLASVGTTADPIAITKKALDVSKSNIEELAEATKSGDPVELTKKALDMGVREMTGAAKVVGKLLNPKGGKK